MSKLKRLGLALLVLVLVGSSAAAGAWGAVPIDLATVWILWRAAPGLARDCRRAAATLGRRRHQGSPL